jgi:hypothetical protein
MLVEGVVEEFIHQIVQHQVVEELVVVEQEHMILQLQMVQQILVVVVVE